MIVAMALISPLRVQRRAALNKQHLDKLGDYVRTKSAAGDYFGLGASGMRTVRLHSLTPPTPSRNFLYHLLFVLARADCTRIAHVLPAR
eukprot:COSAG05_NODE_518_length_9058_cov_13.477732_4_plen_89_part_00